MTDDPEQLRDLHFALFHLAGPGRASGALLFFHVNTLGARSSGRKKRTPCGLHPTRPPSNAATSSTVGSEGCAPGRVAAGEPLERALDYGSAAGALAATRPGAQPSLPTADEVAALLGGRAG